MGKRLQKLHVLPVESIEAFVAEGELVFASTGDERFLLEKTLRDLEARLDPERFARVHKQAIEFGKVGRAPTDYEGRRNRAASEWPDHRDQQALRPGAAA